MAYISIIERGYVMLYDGYHSDHVGTAAVPARPVAEAHLIHIAGLLLELGEIQILAV